MGETLVQRDADGDQSRAGVSLARALEMSRQYCLSPLETRIAGMEDRYSGAKSQEYPDGLTIREMDVIKALVSGKTDQEIADELFISVKTASNHVGNILRKTGCGNRTEAAAYAHSHGLAL